MNKHLNIYTSYSEGIDPNHQIENNLTRALAICLQENSLFFHEIIKNILGETIFNSFFEDLKNETSISINIQQPASIIGDFKRLFAVSLSGYALSEESFFQQSHKKVYDPICDLIVRINEYVIVFEAKRDDTDCIAQLYNQAFNILVQNGYKEEDLSKDRDLVTPFDLNWRKLMTTAVKVAGFENAVGSPNRFLADFVELMRKHNFSWLPEVPISSLSSENKGAIERRISNALAQSKNPQIQEARVGFYLPVQWTKELIFLIRDTGELVCATYPGNTKQQGNHLFALTEKPEFSKSITLLANSYQVSKTYHIKFSSFSKYFTGLWFSENDLISNIYTRSNFNQFAGRKKRPQWEELEQFFDQVFKPEFNWRENCGWNAKMLNSNRSQFDVSFGYAIAFVIPFEDLKTIDTVKEDIEPLQLLLEDAYQKMPNLLIKQ